MATLKRITSATVGVLQILCREPNAVAAQLMIKQTGYDSGTIYPILGRLEEMGWIRSYLRQDENRTGPRRRYFEITDEGQIGARVAIASFEARVRAVK